MSGRHQTTKGIWLAAAGKVASPRTLLLDLEGSDGRERGEDDNSFERQSSLFALAVSDCLLVNMWAKDVGREAGAGKPLLKTIFQACTHVQMSVLFTGHCTNTHACMCCNRLCMPGCQRESLAGSLLNNMQDCLIPCLSVWHGAGEPEALHAGAQPAQDGAAVCVPRQDADAPGAADRDLGGGPARHVGRHHQAARLRAVLLHRLLRGQTLAALTAQPLVCLPCYSEQRSRYRAAFLKWPRPAWPEGFLACCCWAGAVRVAAQL